VWQSQQAVEQSSQSGYQAALPTPEGFVLNTTACALLMQSDGKWSLSISMNEIDGDSCCFAVWHLLSSVICTRPPPQVVSPSSPEV
jgi:hypothetical protein